MKFIIDKRILFLVATLIFVSCKTSKTTKDNSSDKKEEKRELVRKDNTVYYTEQVKNDFRAVTENAQYKFLEAYKATDKQYSILFFTQGFNGDDVVVKNNDETIFKGSVLTNKKTGLAKNMRINNTEETSIYDKSTKKTIYIKGDKARKHKFIYVMKGNADEDKPYKITYSDKLRPEK
ncbi:hypothetical protein H1R17_07425 [Flavobacterium sp. xlx-214]|uniref:hypothetical protein n=1 Tax=unclassified Flavobacterium TaxID=196869 RepID=UPI0013D376CA|nr:MULTISPECIES: hypothetical protein [unclassified Flavobacterium]MBA5792350.1 hypothetical protein [Flavobacterium sp. xlx-221]QMI82335.1 hypothetical protein H1R17_07425 [Flavobacterium sp. xlx-214]